MPAAAAPRAADEAARQCALDGYRVLDSLPEQAYEDIVRLASTLCGTRSAMVTLIDRDRQWFKARLGFDQQQTPRDVAVCDHAIRTPERLLEIPDLGRDPRFARNPHVDGRLGSARFYAGAPLLTPDGVAIGTVCVMDGAPRTLTEAQREGLRALARLTMVLLDGRSRERALGHEAFVAATTQPVAPEPPRAAGYTLALLELQDHAGTAARLGERATERTLQALDEEFERCIDADHGDAVTRASGSAEYIAVLHGDDAAATLERLRQAAARHGRSHGLRFLVGVASTRGDESPHAVFLRADADLLASKETAREAA